MKNRLFITGGTGFIGSWFLNLTGNCGFQRTVLKRPGAEPRVSLANQPIWVVGSLDSARHYDFTEIDTFVHLAAHSANFPYDSIEQCVYWNVSSSLRLLESARKQGVSNFLVAGTAFEYGLSGSGYDKIPPNAPLFPTMTYPASKAMSFIGLNQWAIQHKVKLRYVRIFQVYGEGEHYSRLYPTLKSAALSGSDLDLSLGQQIRDFIHVTDVASQLVEKLDFSNVHSGAPLIENIGTGIGITVREFAEREWTRLGATGSLTFGALQYRENEIMRLVAG